MTGLTIITAACIDVKDRAGAGLIEKSRGARPPHPPDCGLQEPHVPRNSTPPENSVIHGPATPAPLSAGGYGGPGTVAVETRSYGKAGCTSPRQPDRTIMGEPLNLSEIDAATDSDIRTLAGHQGGPYMSMFMPTHRAGPETRQDPLRFRNLLGEAAARLSEQGLTAREVVEFLAPIASLDGDTVFWRHMADGLAVFLAPGFHRQFRVPLDLEEGLFVGNGFRLRPLLPLTSENGSFFVLSLSQNEVRLFEATRSNMGEIDLGPRPGSLAEALADEEHQRQLQVRSSGKANAAGRSMYHGHGAGEEIDKQQLERYFRAVDGSLGGILGEGGHPLVLACVAYYAPIYRAVSRYPVIAEGCVEGSPEERSPRELHAAAWPLVAPLLAAARRDAEARLAAVAGTGRSINDPVAIADAARQGRVDTLFLAAAEAFHARPSPDLTPPADEDLLEGATRDTLRAGGAVFAEDPGWGRAAALLRY